MVWWQWWIVIEVFAVALAYFMARTVVKLEYWQLRTCKGFLNAPVKLRLDPRDDIIAAQKNKILFLEERLKDEH